MLTVHIMSFNDGVTLGRCLDSIESAFPSSFCRIVVADAGSTDGTREICRRRDVRVVDIDPGYDLSIARNRVVTNETDWQFYLEPWEVLADGGDYIYHTVKDDGPHLRFRVLQGDILDKQVRLWKRSRAGFVGRVHERVSLDGGAVAGVIAAGRPTNGERNKKIVERWCEASPTNPDAHYFRACVALGERRFKDFLRDCEYYNFLGPSGKTARQATMLRYYEGCVECFREKRPDRAIQRCLACIAARPTMAEFWCLLGDIHYHILQKFDKALEFYENAMVLGSRRVSDDDWPMEISKYRDYPAKLAESCRRIVSASQSLGLVEHI